MRFSSFLRSHGTFSRCRVQETCASHRRARLLVAEKPAARLAEIVRRLVILVDHRVGIIAAHEGDSVAGRTEKLVEVQRIYLEVLRRNLVDRPEQRRPDPGCLQRAAVKDRQPDPRDERSPEFSVAWTFRTERLVAETNPEKLAVAQE